MARRDNIAALAGLAALTALMGRKKNVPVEDRTPIRAETATDEYESLKPTKTQYGAFGEPPTDTTKTLEDAPQSEKGRVAPARATPAVTPAAGSGRGGRGGPTAAQMAAYYASQRPVAGDVRKADAAAEQRRLRERQERMETPGSQAIEQDLDVLTPFPGLKRVGTAAKMLARETPQLTGPAARPLLEGPAARKLLQGPAKREALEGPPKRELLTYDARKARAEAMEEAKPILQARPGKADIRDRTRFKDDELGVEFKKGGKTKVKKMASGGMARSSASKRADGIAQRGKTRGKVY